MRSQVTYILLQSSRVGNARAQTTNRKHGVDRHDNQEHRKNLRQIITNISK